ncbi:hypothetical protein, partial [Pseudomonas aeruginosa]|uniref:hypothetical protein n=3 Tax=Pseudomonas aeruginosa TaxID=287 RepID=UPI003EBCB417
HYIFNCQITKITFSQGVERKPGKERALAAPRKAPALQGFAGIHRRRMPPAAPAKPAGWGPQKVQKKRSI